MATYDEPKLKRVLCPQGHAVAWNGTYYWCETCMSEYDEGELRTEVVDRNEFPPLYRPTVYGRPN
jgi:hypothetical protein